MRPLPRTAPLAWGAPFLHCDPTANDRVSVNGKMTLLPTKPRVMIERPQQEIASATAEIDEAAHAGLVPQLGIMVRALVASAAAQVATAAA